MFPSIQRSNGAGPDGVRRWRPWAWSTLIAVAGLAAAIFLVGERHGRRPDTPVAAAGQPGQRLPRFGGTGAVPKGSAGSGAADRQPEVPASGTAGDGGQRMGPANTTGPGGMTVTTRSGDPQALADGLEQAIRRRYGVTRRQGKWIPTIGDGTNRVYITTGCLSPGRVGAAYTAQVEAVSGQTPYRWAVVGGALPRVFALDTRSGVIQGLPTDPVATPLFLEVTDARGAKDVAGYVLTVLPTQDLAIVTASLPAAMPGADYTAQLRAAGGVPPYHWSLEGAPVLGGALSLDALAGILRGTLAASVPAGDVPLNVTLSDTQVRVSKTFLLRCGARLAITEVPRIPVYAGEACQFEFRAVGGLEPIVWGLTGDQPPGLAFHPAGRWAGEPSATGRYAVAVWAQDADGWTATEAFTLEVRPERPAAVSGFEALASRFRVALRWQAPTGRTDLAVRIVRSADAAPAMPGDGVTIYAGTGSSCLDGPLAAGRYRYAAFLEIGGVLVTAAPPPALSVSLPPDQDPFADRVVARHLLHTNAYGADRLPAIVLGAPSGAGLARGSLDVLSLGAAVNNDDGATAPYGGYIVLEFLDNAVWDGPGADLTVFENVFYLDSDAGLPDPDTRFMEPAVVLVSQDGATWRTFPTDFSPRYQPGSGALNLQHPYCYHAGFAGINPVLSCGNDPDPTNPDVSGGDSFDLADVGLDRIRFVAIQSTGHRWLRDAQGDLIQHTEQMGAVGRSSRTAGFDLDAVAAIWFHRVSAADGMAAGARTSSVAERRRAGRLDRKDGR